MTPASPAVISDTPRPDDSSPSHSPTPESIPTPTLAVTSEPDKAVTFGNGQLLFSDVRSLRLEGFPHPKGFPYDVGWNLLGDHIIALNEVGNGLVSIGDGSGRAVASPGALWIADLASGTVRRVMVGAGFADVDVDTELLLAWSVDDAHAYFHVIGLEGNELATLRTSPLANAAFLADGTIVVTDHDRIGVWDPVSGVTAWASLPDWLRDPYMRVVGSRVVLACDPCVQAFGEPNTALLDPRTGSEIGPRWLGDGYITAASPDGAWFATEIESDREHWQVDLRDVITGKTLATYSGERYYSLRWLYWLTPDLIVFDEAPSGAGADSEFYIHDTTIFGTKPTKLEPFMEEQTFSQHGSTLLVTNRSGDQLLMQLTESK
jgi:hypothetical protein